MGARVVEAREVREGGRGAEGHDVRAVLGVRAEGGALEGGGRELRELGEVEDALRGPVGVPGEARGVGALVVEVLEGS